MSKITLKWMDMIRNARDMGKSPEDILDMLWAYGMSEEQRITESFNEEFTRI